MKIARVAFIASLFAVSALAASLDKYKGWADSPQAYFMTKAERDQWKEIHDDAAAEQFVNQYVASRGAGFQEELDKRIGVADKYLTVGSTAGSKTLRGKVIILLGPPTEFVATDRASEERPTSAASMYAGAAGSNAEGGLGMSPEDAMKAQQRQGMGGKMVREFSMRYDARKLPAAFGKDIAVIVNADPTTGKDRLADQKQMKDLDALFEMVAAASIRK